ncbi:MAG TPA: hypothetical protein VH575_06145 [Gemmataceae bacterium]|jgi:hypothetical protein
MTEAKWNSCADPQLMLEFLRERGKLCDRKARLYAVACFRSVWDKLSEPASRRAVEVAERFADGKATKEEFDAASDAADEVPWVFVERGDHAAEGFAHAAGWATAPDASTAAEVTARFARGCDQDKKRPDGRYLATDPSEEYRQSLLLRCIFGNPFRPLHDLAPSLLTPAIVGLAQTIYEQRSFERTRELADALEAAGCTDASLLAHLRSPGPHVRGCFALDAMLGKS